MSAKTILLRSDPVADLVTAPVPRALSPGSPEVLGAGLDAVLIETGTVEVYLVVGAARRFLAEFGPGAVLFGGGQHGGDLVAIAPEGARWRPLPGLDIRDPSEIAAAAAAIDGWISALSEGVARMLHARPAMQAALSQETIEAEAGYCVCAARGVVWIEGASGAARYLGQAPVHDTRLPVSQASWIEFDAAARLSASPTAEMLGQRGAAALIAAFHALLPPTLSTILERISEAEDARLAEREQRVEDGLARAQARLRGVLTRRRAPDHASEIRFLIDRLGFGRALRRPGAPQDGGNLITALEGHGLRARPIVLEGAWWSRDHGRLIGFQGVEAAPAVLAPDWRGRYAIHRRGEPTRRLTAEVAAAFRPQALVVSEPFADRPVRILDIVRLGARLCWQELALVALASLIGSGLGLLTPIATGQIIDTFIPDGLQRGLALLGAALLAINLCSSLLRFASDQARLRIDGRLAVAVQSAVVDRIIRLPTGYLKAQSSADLALRILSVDQMRRVVTNTILNTLATGIFGLSSFALLIFYSPVAAGVALGFFALILAAAVAAGFAQLDAIANGEAMTANLSGLTLQLIRNVSTLRAFGAERRAFTRWADNAAASRSRSLAARNATIGFETVAAAYGGVALAAVFWVLGRAAGGHDPLSTGAYLAFVVTYQGLLGSSEGLARAIVQLIGISPTLKRAGQLLATEPESPLGSRHPGELSGEIELSNVGFRYESGGPLVLDGLSLHVPRGSLVAITGPSGCGKSTVVNLLLGFAQPEAGGVFFDGQDLADLDLAAVRRQFGSCARGRLFGGSIFENIVGIHGGGAKEAWAAAALAGIADDIRALPMGMQTILIENAGTFSGGQVQRMLLARALVGQPRILILDEATSALDNITQAIVTRNIESLGITRIVVAHRLSTVRNADVIYFLDRGRVAEVGSFESLMREGGGFAEFARRQTL